MKNGVLAEEKDALENRRRGVRNAETARRVVEEIRPHFIFNVLNQLRYWIVKDPEKAYEMVYDLANYLRVSISAVTDVERVSLKEEMQKLQSYLKLEMMLKKNFRVVWQQEEASGEDEISVFPGELYKAVLQVLQDGVKQTAEPRTLKIENAINKEDYMIRFTVAEAEIIKEWRCPRPENVKGV